MSTMRDEISAIMISQYEGAFYDLIREKSSPAVATEVCRYFNFPIYDDVMFYPQQLLDKANIAINTYNVLHGDNAQNLEQLHTNDLAELIQIARARVDEIIVRHKYLGDFSIILEQSREKQTKSLNDIINNVKD